jgi:hypothetical protein
MTQFVGFEKPSPEESLEHYGVLGMKWGRTRARANGTQIRAARRNVRRQAEDVLDQKDVVKAKTKGSAERAKEQKKLDKMKSNFLDNPDRVIAARLTRGEKIVLAILATPPVAAGAIAGSSAVSRAIEQRQENRKNRK